ncbi:MAG: radical SAM protein [Candidatus Doudnabacteria bacterium]|nr:radical SAM protein [Candidatus Doudnabacteria bacterium]
MDPRNDNANFWVSLHVRPMGDSCNLACRYCEFGKVSLEQRMSDEVLRSVVRKLLEHNGGSGVFCWHGGEPTLAGVDFFERAVQYQREFAPDFSKVINQIQTNGVGLSEELVTLFARERFGVGLSLDGPETLHNLTRVNKGNAGSYQQVVAGLQLLRSHGIDPAVIATVSRDALPYAEATFQHLVNLGFKNIHYSVVFDSKPDGTLAVTNDEWYGYLRNVFHAWYEMADETIQVRELNEVISWIVGEPDPCCTSLGTCAHWMTVNPDGNVSPCEVMGKTLRYGNILTDTFASIIASVGHRELVKLAAFRPSICQSCEFLSVCNNGCTNMRTSTSGSQNPRGLYAYCHERQQLFREIVNVFEEGTS